MFLIKMKITTDEIIKRSIEKAIELEKIKNYQLGKQYMAER